MEEQTNNLINSTRDIYNKNKNIYNKVLLSIGLLLSDNYDKESYISLINSIFNINESKNKNLNIDFTSNYNNKFVNKSIFSSNINKLEYLYFFNKFTIKSNNFDIQGYINRLVNYIDCEEINFYYSFLLICRLINNYEIKFFNNKNVYLIFFIALVISIKTNEDKTFSNKDYATIGCIPLKLFAKLENIFLELIDYNIIFSTIC